VTAQSPTLKDRIDALLRRYRSGYAGQPRLTRDVSGLEALISELTGLRSELAADPDGVAVGKTIDDLEQSWTAELAAVREAQGAGPEVKALQSIEQWLDDVLGRYRRNFAGKGRPTRDLGILAEIIDDLEWLQDQLAAVIASHPGANTGGLADSIQRNLDMARREETAIRDSRQGGLPSGRATGYAQLANSQFARYRLHFAGKPRGSRRRSTLVSIVRTLEDLYGEMQGIVGAPTQPHQGNLEVVKKRLELYRTELGAVASAMQGFSVDARNLALGDEANQIMVAYREGFAGISRQKADPELLDQLWERLWTVAREMAELRPAQPIPSLDRNLQLVRDTLRLFAREHTAIVEARKGK
jgi:hypothetical protein